MSPKAEKKKGRKIYGVCLVGGMCVLLVCYGVFLCVVL